MTTTATPERFEIEIDRKGLLRYLRLQHLVVILPVFLLFGGLFGLAACGRALDRLEHMSDTTLQGYAVLLASRIGMGLAIGLVLGVLFYLSLAHSISRRVAESLALRVDGMFLQIIKNDLTRVDRKIHFNKINDYAVVEGPLMRRCGIRALTITSATTGLNGVIVIPGVIDVERVRDLLCAIDRQREDRVS